MGWQRQEVRSLLDLGLLRCDSPPFFVMRCESQMGALKNARRFLGHPFGFAIVDRRYSPVKQRVPFVRGCVPDSTDSIHDKSRVKFDHDQVIARGR